jgi:hypothetical protein
MSRENLYCIRNQILLAVFALGLLLTGSCSQQPVISDETSNEALPTTDIPYSYQTQSSEQVPTSPASYEGNSTYDDASPSHTVKLIFIHHSSGENWLSDENGGLGIALRDQNYFVSDTNYDWGPYDAALDGPIGSYTDIGHWWNWFLGPSRNQVIDALFTESGQHASYSRMEVDPGGENEIILFKSCFPNSALGGNPDDPLNTGENPLFGEGAGSEFHTVANAKGVYTNLLSYFSTRQDKLFIVITAPPLHKNNTNPQQAANARAFNRWLVEAWLQTYPYKNVAVFDFYNVLTSNGGSKDRNDLESPGGNHHRFNNGQIEYITDKGSNYSAYATADDDHPTSAGNQKATAEFVPLLNIAYHIWNGE